ncbi:GlsB/YeaQ/YmgE family stress response membrane protein [Nocardioides marinquilinus]|uniref:GlsB/YeaQ/YmgE family stress response membrane protein n=1 Tax=Nocardioides marinquilinus TaxID=1210400 RepID=A0ABP9Q520_9ACTN
MLGLILTIVVVGALAGFVARLLIPGRQDLSVVATIAIGIVGSFVGGLLGYLLLGDDADAGLLQPSGVLGSIVGAVIVLLIWTATQRHHSSRRTASRI